MRYPFYLDVETALRVAELLEQDGLIRAASDVWFNLSMINPYDRARREKLGDMLYESHTAEWPLGTVQRSRMILRVCALAFPTPKTRNAYFENLELLMRGRPKRSEAGRLVLGVGSGRCASTTLSGAFSTLPDVCSTHENPPVVFWVPPEEHLQFHVDRFRLLVQHYSIVFDASHSWLNAMPRMFAEFPELRVLGLYRQTEPCVQSFMNQKGSGKGSVNHWVPPGNGYWNPSLGDPWYPTYPVPELFKTDPYAAKRELVTRYVTEYNRALFELAEARPDGVLLVPTEELNTAETAARIREFLGFELPMPAQSLNVGGSTDSDNMETTF